MLASHWSTPIATPVATPTVVEPLSVVLAKQIDINEKINQISASINSHSRIVSDAVAIVEQLPALLVFLRDASASNVWLTEEAAEKLFSLFSVSSQTSIVRLLVNQQSLSFVFPLASLPSSVDWSRDFDFFKYLNFSKKSKQLINLASKSITLDAIDYYFFAMAVLPLITADTTTTSRSAYTATSSTTTRTTTPSTGWSGQHWGSPTQSKTWYDADKKGSIHERVLMELVELGVTGHSGVVRSAPIVLHKCEMVLSVIADMYLNLTIYSFNSNINFSRNFELVNKVFRLLVQGAGIGATQPVVAGFVDKYGKLMTDLFDSSNFYSQKFLHRMDAYVLIALARCWHDYCLPWSVVGRDSISTVPTSVKDQWIRRHADVYSVYQALLTVSPIVDFVNEFKLHNSSESQMQKFIALLETPEFVGAMVKVLAVVSPDTGIAEALPNIFTCSASVELSKYLWFVCRSCTWVGGKVPKQTADASWEMDGIVNATKGLSASDSVAAPLYALFTWDTPEGDLATVDGVPKRLTNWMANKMDALLVDSKGKKAAAIAWNQPVCAHEYALVVRLLKYVVGIVSDTDLKANPLHFAWVRHAASVSLLLLTAFMSWLYVSVSMCPRMGSRVSIAVTQISFIFVVGLLAIKWVASQYIV